MKSLPCECEWLAEEKTIALGIKDRRLFTQTYKLLLHCIKLELGGYRRIPRKLKKQLKKQGKYNN